MWEVLHLWELFTFDGLTQAPLMSFTVLEVAKDSGKFRHWEASLLKLCQDTALFVPHTSIEVSGLVYFFEFLISL